MYCPNISRPCSPAPRRHKPVTLRPARRALTRGSTECRPLRPLIACTHSCCRNQRALPALLPANAPGGRRARGGPRLGTAGARAGHACHQQCGRRHPAPGARPVAYASCHLLGAPVWDPPPHPAHPHPCAWNPVVPCSAPPRGRPCIGGRTIWAHAADCGRRRAMSGGGAAGAIAPGAHANQQCYLTREEESANGLWVAAGGSEEPTSTLTCCSSQLLYDLIEGERVP
jgi:hypothetical protein